MISLHSNYAISGYHPARANNLCAVNSLSHMQTVGCREYVGTEYMMRHCYFKTLTVCGIKFSRLNKNDILARFYFGVHDLQSLQIVNQDVNL